MNTKASVYRDYIADLYSEMQVTITAEVQTRVSVKYEPLILET